MLTRRRAGLHLFGRTARCFYANGARYNEAKIQMLSAGLHKQVFPDNYTRSRPPSTSPQLVKLSLEHLEKHKIPVHEGRPARPEISLELPPLLGNDIEEHFYRLGTMLNQPYYDLAANFATNGPRIDMNLNFMMDKWESRAGWTKYTLDGKSCGPVPFPEEAVMVFDVETCPDHGPWPLMAVALTQNYTYAWVSPYLFNENPDEKCRLIPFDNSKPSMCIGHNISYDRARIRDEYSLKKGSRRFLDTLSLHCAVGGLSSQQRAQWATFKKQQLLGEGTHVSADADSQIDLEQDEETSWKNHCSMNNLADAVRLHCNYELDKNVRNILVKGALKDVQKEFQTIMTYCANDVAATYGLFFELWPKFTQKCGHPISFAAILEMGTCLLPTNNSWKEYAEKAEVMYTESVEHIEKLLRELVERMVEEGQKNDAWKTDPWLNKLDWTPVPARYTKEKLKADGSYAKDGEPRPIGNVNMFGKPAWYKKIFSSKENRPEITPKTRILPYLLRMKWEGNPVHFIEDCGWCYSILTDTNEKGRIVRDKDGNYYSKIPHHEREGANVGSLMTKHHLKFYEKGVLTTDSDIVKEVLQLNTQFSFWTGYRERIKEQFVVWSDEPGVDLGFTSGTRAGMIIPTLIMMGTVTRRAVENTWMTATNSKKNLVGSELKSKIIAPDGYVFVGADVDSQELWISSLLGDAQFGFAGATALGWMTLQGDKADNTDLHSRTASILGMSRNDAKIFNYGRIYGAGVGYAAQLLQKFNPNMPKSEAEERAKNLYKATKGTKKDIVDQNNEHSHIYTGGTESFMFNILESIARSPASKTPTLSAEISDALTLQNVRKEFLTSRVNWAVQSSGVDYLHMLICSMNYLLRRHGIDGRLAITIHDEVRFLIAERDKYRGALALQIANIWTRAMFAHRAGMTDLPLSVAFFSAVDFDNVLRKEATTDCVTPSNPIPVPPGFAMDIYSLLEKVPDGLGPVVDPMELKRIRKFVRPIPVVKTATTEALREQIGSPNPPSSPSPSSHPSRPSRSLTTERSKEKCTADKPTPGSINRLMSRWGGLKDRIPITN